MNAQTEALAKMIARAIHVVADCDQAIRDIDYMEKLHSNDPAWSWLPDERAKWEKMRMPVQSFRVECTKRLAELDRASQAEQIGGGK